MGSTVLEARPGHFTALSPPPWLLLLLERKDVLSVNLLPWLSAPHRVLALSAPKAWGATSLALPQPGSPCTRAAALHQLHTTHTMPSWPSQDPGTPGSGRGIPARQSLHHRHIYWQNLFPGIEGKGTSGTGGFLSSVRGAEGRGGRDISTRTKPAANIY